MVIIPGHFDQKQPSGLAKFFSEKKNVWAVVIIFVVLLITAGVLYWGFFYSPSPVPKIQPSVSTMLNTGSATTTSTLTGSQIVSQNSAAALLNLDLDISILDGPVLQSLKTFGSYPPEIGTKGRSMPYFAP